MIVFQYDASFEGFLSAVFDAYTTKQFPAALATPNQSMPLLATVFHHVATCPHKAARVWKGAQHQFSPFTLRQLILLWLAEEAESDTLLFHYICTLFNTPAHKRQNYADPTTLKATKLARKVTDEYHRLLGFIRFQKTTQNIYFATVAPVHNTLPLTLPHFTNRFAHQQWLLYDSNRKTGFYYDTAKVHDVHLTTELDQNGSLSPELLSADEMLFQQLWQSYFRATTIQERLNPAQQKRFMPKRFWKYMTEVHNNNNNKSLPPALF